MDFQIDLIVISAAITIIITKGNRKPNEIFAGEKGAIFEGFWSLALWQGHRSIGASEGRSTRALVGGLASSRKLPQEKKNQRKGRAWSYGFSNGFIQSISLFMLWVHSRQG